MTQLDLERKPHSPPHTEVSQVRKLPRIERMIARRLQHLEFSSHLNLAFVLGNAQHAETWLPLRHVAEILREGQLNYSRLAFYVI